MTTTTHDALAAHVAAEVAKARAEDAKVIAQAWTDGEPPKYMRDEWFIAETIHGERVVLRALPEEYTYDYMTVDHTYMAAENIKRWMQFPDSSYKSFVPTDYESLRSKLTFPDDVLDFALKIGRAEWGQTDPKTAAEHAADMASTVEKTAAHFGQTEPQSLNGLYIEGTGIVICHTGVSPNSPEIARILTGLWNMIYDTAQIGAKP